MVRTHQLRSPLAGLLVVAGLAAGCTSGPTTNNAGVFTVVAAENVWGSLAAQLGGSRVIVTSIVKSASADPHDYEPTPSDARRVAAARYAIVTGAGYDSWAAKMLAANPRRSTAVLDVGALVGVDVGGNPHRWYSPPDVLKVVDQIVGDYKRLAPADAAYFDQRKTALLSTGLARYASLIAEIKAKYAGTPVGASESIFSPLAEALGLKLVTPASFLDAITAGADPTAADKATCDAQIRAHAIKIYVFNSQNTTPDVNALVGAARGAGIPVTSVTETLSPPGASFQDWQVVQLQSLAAALERENAP